MAINQEMPEDVLTEILSRLPVKSLLRFKPVSKHWCSLIQNPSFISLHNNRSPKNDSLLIKQLLGRPSKLTLSSLSNETPIHNIDIPFSCPLDTDLHLVGSSNGVVCLANSFQILLCNPAMREFRELPQPRNWTRPTSHLGFAFDPQTNDFNVLRVAAVYELDHGSTKYTRVGEKVEIYNNKSMSLWREIIAVVPKGKDIRSRLYRDTGSGSQLYHLTWLDGVFYWVAKDPDGRTKIIAFHMFDELFEQVFLLEDIRIIDMSSLCVMRDSLALVAFKYPSLLLDIWLRDGKGVKDLWVKRYSIGLTLGRHEALGFRQNGELLRLRDNDRRLESYNFDTQKIEEYHDVYNGPTSINFEVLSYTESLVSVKWCVYRDMICAKQPSLHTYSTQRRKLTN